MYRTDGTGAGQQFDNFRRPSENPKHHREMTAQDGGRVMNLRYAGTCELCGIALPARSIAVYDPDRKKVRCVTCPSEPVSPPATPEAPLSTGTAGASARREYERRAGRRQARIDAAIEQDAARREQMKRGHPVLGRVRSAVTPRPVIGPEPQHIAAWKKGADGERILGGMLDEWSAATGGIVLHDRRIRGTKANVDHIAIASSGVWVIDAKEYSGQVELVNGGTIFRPDQQLRVGRRNKSQLAEGVGWQMTKVAEALDQAAGDVARPPVHGVLGFVNADWALFARPFVFNGVTVAWPRAVVKRLSEPGEDTPEQIKWTAEVLATAFPPA